MSTETEAVPEAKKFATMGEFYPFYLSEHSNRTSRRLHFAGTTLGLAWMATAIVTLNPWFLLAGLVCGYAFAWVGHFFFEKNTPATFKYPLWSLMGDFRLFFETVTGKRRW